MKRSDVFSINDLVKHKRARCLSSGRIIAVKQTRSDWRERTDWGEMFGAACRVIYKSHRE